MFIDIMADLLDEVKEELKEEKYNQIVKKIVQFFAYGATTAILIVTFYVWKEHSATKLQDKLGTLFNQAMASAENNQLDEAIIHLNKIIEHSHQQYAALAYLHKAAILHKQNKYTDGQKTLLEMGEHKHFDVALRELAQIVYFGNQLNSKEPEIEQTDKMLVKLTKEHKTWRLSALQLKALYDIKHNKINDAKTNLNEIITAKQAGKSSYDTASSMLNVISRTE